MKFETLRELYKTWTGRTILLYLIILVFLAFQLTIDAYLVFTFNPRGKKLDVVMDMLLIAINIALLKWSELKHKRETSRLWK